MDIFNECLYYFKSNKGFDRLMKKIKNKYISLDKLSGTITIDNPSILEKEAISGFMKKDYSRNKSIRINVSKFISRLKQTRFDKVDFKEILCAYFNEEIFSKKTIKKEYEYTKKSDFDKILKNQESQKAYRYIQYLLFENGRMHKRIIELYNLNKKLFYEIIDNTCSAVNNLPLKKEKLSVFSAKITKNPHYFDYNKLPGKILLDALTYLNALPIPSTTEQKSRALYLNNILIDDVSNMVLCSNILGYCNEKIHPIWKAMCDTNESLQITLSNLSSIDRVNAYNNFVLVVENPNVYTSLTSMLKDKQVSIVCTYGQVKLSAIYLLDMLVNENIKIYYSGDIDPEGVIIADKLKQKYKDNIELIYFDESTYIKNISNQILDEKRLKKLSCVKSSELNVVKTMLLKYKKAAYEELNIKELFLFLNNNI